MLLRQWTVSREDLARKEWTRPPHISVETVGTQIDTR